MKVISPTIYQNSGFERCQTDLMYKRPKVRLWDESTSGQSVKDKSSVTKNIPATSVNFCGYSFLNKFKDLFVKNPETNIPKWAEIMSKKGSWFEKLTQFTLRNENYFEAIISLGLVTGIKPLFTLFMPGAKKDDKEVLAAKHIISGFFGFAMSMTLYKIINEGMNKISENPYKYIKDVDFAKQFKDNLNTKNGVNIIFKKGTEIALAPFKSRVTIWAVPLILGALFAGDAVNKTKNDKVEHKGVDKSNLSDEEKTLMSATISSQANTFMKNFGGVK